MPTQQEYWQMLRSRRSACYSWLRSRDYNAPHPLAEVALSGSLSYTVDERLFTSPPATAYVSVMSVDFSSAAAWTRINEDQTPFTLLGGDGPSGRPADGNFLMLHSPQAPWEFFCSYGYLSGDVVVGDVVVDKYLWNSRTSSYDFDRTATYNVSMEWSLIISGGGHPASGGKDASADTEKTTIQIVAYLSGGGTGARLPSSGINVSFGRFPWDSAWTSETAAFGTWFDDFLDAENSDDGAGHSGTCSISADFN